MAFGAIVEVKTGVQGSGATSVTTAAFTGITDGNLVIAAHMTGDGNSIGPSGYNEDVVMTNGASADESAIYSKEASSEGTTITCTSDSADEHTLCGIEIEGPVSGTPGTRLDLSQAESVTSGASTYNCAPGGPTAQNSEICVAHVYVRAATLVTRNPTNSFIERAALESDFKQGMTFTKLLTSTESPDMTIDIQVSNSGAMGGMVTYKEDLGGGPGATGKANPMSGPLGGPLAGCLG